MNRKPAYNLYLPAEHSHSKIFLEKVLSIAKSLGSSVRIYGIKFRTHLKKLNTPVTNTKQTLAVFVTAFNRKAW